jgi:hypothetical protein
VLHRISASITLITIASGVPLAALAESPERFSSEVKVFGDVLLQQQNDQWADVAEEQAEAGTEFFTALPGESAPQRTEDPVLEQFVSFRLNGVPYALKDVPSKAWFAPYVRDMAERAIVTGYKDKEGIPTGVFGPERSVSVEELAKMALEAARIDRMSCPAAPKNEAAKLSWSASYISCAEDKGFALYADATVDIARPATRAEVVMTILQAFGAPIRELGDAPSPFKDITAGTLFSGAIFTAYQDGIIAGYPDGTFGPDKLINRAEVSKVLSMAIQVYGKK